jgi:N-methylhydantoinase A
VAELLRLPGPAADGYLLGVDIGGTFTDFVLCHAPTGRVWLEKRLTTAEEPARGVREGLARLLGQAGVATAALETVVHGTTLITNALIERKGARTALLATDGYRDVLEIGTELRYDPYDLFLEVPEPLVPRPFRFDVPERLSASGLVRRPLDEPAVTRIAAALREESVEAVAVCYLHAFLNPAHERRTREILAATLPDAAVSLSSEVAPEIREYQRLSTTAANAYVQPLADRYLARLQQDLADAGYRRPLYLMLSSGGIVTHEAAARFPIRLAESGPAAGALATATLGQRLGRNHLISFDMGGTTAKACLIDDGEPTIAREFEVARVKRFVRGSGLPLQVPVIEMIEIGAGGGSIAWVDGMGLLKVGPESAGSDPGPVCYGRGGTRPTVTDADLVLGYLDVGRFLGGQMRLDAEGARAALDALAAELGLDAVRLARGIFDVVNANMIAAAKVHAAERGRDPRRYALVAFGGMGPMHAHAVATGIRVREVICPASAGVLSAWGLLVAPSAFELARSLMGVLDDALLGRTEAVYAAMETEGRRLLAEAGVSPDVVRIRRSADMRYASQTREITVPLSPPGSDCTVEGVRRVFHDHYRRMFGHAHDDLPVQLITCRLTASAAPRVVPNRATPAGRSGNGAGAPDGERPVFFESAGGYVRAAVYDRYHLPPGAAFRGPAVVEERESTAVVPPGAMARVDGDLNLVLDLAGGG